MRWVLLRAVMLIVVACVAGCPAPTTTPPGIDAPDIDEDGPPSGTARLTINWAINPQVPGGIADDRELDDVRFRMENFQVLGDGNPSSAPRIEKYKLRWNASTVPEPVSFASVPMGLYSSIVFQLSEGDDEDAFEIEGSVETDEEREFEIKDTDNLSISITGFSLMLDAGQDVTVTIGIDLQAAIAEIDFAEMETTNGDYVIRKGVDPQIGTFRTRLSQAFVVDGPM